MQGSSFFRPALLYVQAVPNDIEKTFLPSQSRKVFSQTLNDKIIMARDRVFFGIIGNDDFFAVGI